jgi:hypothetical protein
VLDATLPALRARANRQLRTPEGLLT